MTSASTTASVAGDVASLRFMALIKRHAREAAIVQPWTYLGGTNLEASSWLDPNRMLSIIAL